MAALCCLTPSPVWPWTAGRLRTCEDCEWCREEKLAGSSYTLQQCQDECAKTSDCFGVNFGKGAKAGECYLSTVDVCCVEPGQGLDAYQMLGVDTKRCSEEVQECPETCRSEIADCAERCKTPGCAGCRECPSCAALVPVCSECSWCGEKELVEGTFSEAECLSVCEKDASCHAASFAKGSGDCWLGRSDECCAETSGTMVDVFQKVETADCLLDYPLVSDRVIREVKASQDTFLERS